MNLFHSFSFQILSLLPKRSWPIRFVITHWCRSSIKSTFILLPINFYLLWILWLSVRSISNFEYIFFASYIKFVPIVFPDVFNYTFSILSSRSMFVYDLNKLPRFLLLALILFSESFASHSFSNMIFVATE